MTFVPCKAIGGGMLKLLFKILLPKQLLLNTPLKINNNYLNKLKKK